MPKFISITNAILAVPSMNPLTRAMEMQIGHAIFGLDEEGRVWEFISGIKKWRMLPMTFEIPEGESGANEKL